MREERFDEKEGQLRTQLAKTTQWVGRHFSRTEAADAAGAYLQSLLSKAERKNTWQMSEAVGRRTPYAFQHLLGRALWDADAVRDEHVRHVCEGLGSRDGILTVDETGFLKKGDKSAGVGRQYTGTAGRIENCQVGVFLSWKTKKGHTLLDRELYVPKDWCADRARCGAASIPKQRGFQTKAELARRMIERVLQLGIRPSWVTADEVYGHDGKFRSWLEEIGQRYVVAIPSNHYVTRCFKQSKVSELLKELEDKSWTQLDAGIGTKGRRTYAWSALPINHPYGPSWTRLVLFRRSLSDPSDIAFYIVYCSFATSLAEIVKAAGARWSIEECFESSKGEVGLDHYEVRSYHGWYRHMTLAMIAHALLVLCRATTFAPPTRTTRITSLHAFKKKQRLSSASASRRSAASFSRPFGK